MCVQLHSLLTKQLAREGGEGVFHLFQEIPTLHIRVQQQPAREAREHSLQQHSKSKSSTKLVLHYVQQFHR
jgi:hypothetical protein